MEKYIIKEHNSADIRELASCDFIHADKVIVIGNCHKNPELIPKKAKPTIHPF